MARYRSNENKGKKNSTVYTPADIAIRIAEIIRTSGLEINSVLDLGIGEGALSKPLNAKKIIGIDVASKGKRHCDLFFKSKLEKIKPKDTEKIIAEQPSIVVSNPPFNGAPGKQLYPEIFMEWVFNNLGDTQPFVMITPMGVRLNQRRKSARWRKMKGRGQITSILTLPIDTFDGVLFHVEVLFFNIPNIKAHYFLED